MTTITMEEYELMKDSKYRMYVAAVDKALKNFEYTSEWADLISALGKLNKVLLSYTKYPVIPRRIKISKRLAQCMHPALPSGVHLKALESYDIIFKCMGTNRLSNELFIYSAGLFPLLGHAAMNIRPALLKVYETHFVPLRERLRPALSGFLSGVLPGLEVGSDYFERTNILLENVCDGVGPAWFYTCIWQCVRSNSPVRLAAISYVLAHYNKKISMEDQLYLMGNDIDIMVTGLCAALQDSSVLVQRSALDLLMVCFPMHNTQLLYADMVKLVTAALSTILRRDMSLNRRLYSWLLDTENVINQNKEVSKHLSSTQGTAYDLLIEALKVILKQSSSDTCVNVKPYRLLTSLFDKPQIGPVILDTILYEVFRALYFSCLNRHKTKQESIRVVSFNGDITSLKDDVGSLSKQFLTQNCQELIKNANLLFNTLQSSYIWSYLEKLYEKAASDNKKTPIKNRYQVNEIGTGEPSLLEICILSDFLLDIIPIEVTSVDENTQILPNLFVKIVKTMNRNLSILNDEEISGSLKLCAKILKKIQPPLQETVIRNHHEHHQNEEPDSKQMFLKLEEQKPDNSSCVSPSSEVFERELKVGLEKSKSDSTINENFKKNELTVENGFLELMSNRERSNSNQMLKKKEKSSPKIDKKGKNKKSKSSSKLYDMRKANEESGKDSEEQNKCSGESNETRPDTLPLQVEVANIDVSNDIYSHEKNQYVVNCLHVFKKFYILYVREKILSSSLDVERFFEALVHDKQERIKKLEGILSVRLKSNDLEQLNRNTFSSILNNSSEDFLSLLRKPSPVDNGIFNIYTYEFEEAMCCASNILLDFSTFPGLLEEENSDPYIPLWFKVLVTCACSSEVLSKNVQITAMNIILEVISLAKSQNYERRMNLKSSNVITMGILGMNHVEFIEESTVILEVMGHILWNLLGCSTDQQQIIQCVKLIYQIHNIFENNSFIENVICKHMNEDKYSVEYFKRFIFLWHLGRDLNVKLPPHQHKIRNFDKAFLKLLDFLQKPENSSIKLLAESFLTHGLLRNDLPRMIDPLLTMLLSPNTARVSIRYININGTDSYSNCDSKDYNGSTDSDCKKVYAVSNINGNVMYHVTDGSSSPKLLKNKWFMFSKLGGNDKKDSKVVNTTASITENFNVVTRKNVTNMKVESISLCSESDKISNVKLFVNPLSASRELCPEGASGSYTKLESETYKDKSSSESLSSGNGLVVSNIADRDSGFESHLEIGNGKSGDFKLGKHLEPSLNNVAPVKNSSKLYKSQSFDEKISASKESDHVSLVHSWSYSISDSDNLNAELELSTTAEDYFKGEDQFVVQEVLNDLINTVCQGEEDKIQNSEMTSNLSASSTQPKLNELQQSSRNFSLCQMHYHICLYCEVIDSKSILFALDTLKNCIETNPNLFIKSLSTSGVKDLKNNDLLYLLARHRKSILGKGFSGELIQEYVNFYRGYTFLDIIISLCLNYARSFYSDADDTKFTEEEIDNNLQIQVKSLEILDIVAKNLITLVKESNSKGFSGYVADTLFKCKLQKVLLHCLLTSVRNFDDDMTFAEKVLFLNNFKLYDSNGRVPSHMEAFQTQLLRLVQSLIILEHHLFTSNTDSSVTNSISGSTTPSIEHPSYSNATLIPQQQIFLSAILSALRHQNMNCLHQSWCNMVTSCLPYFGDHLKQIVLSVILQLCNNVEKISDTYKKSEVMGELSTDYAITLLEFLTIMCHYCVLDYTQVNTQGMPSVLNSGTPVSNPGDLFNNLVNAFFSPAVQDSYSISKQNKDNYLTARKAVLSHMPRIITSIAKLWQTITGIEGDYNGIYGNCRIVKQHLLEFLSPIAVHHSSSFLAAIAVVWHERRNPFSNVKAVLPEPNASQNNLVYLISAIRVIPLDNLVQTVTAVIKNPPPIEGLSNEICLDVSTLELFYCYMCNASETQLSEAWSSLLALIREGSSLSPPAQFLLAAILHELMIKCCPLEEKKKDQKDLQDVTAKLIECVSQVCGSCLEQTNWLRRNLAVKEHSDDVHAPVGLQNGGGADLNQSGVYSVQAQLLLSEILASILDICYGSSEKEKVNTILTNLMYNIVPYLKTHTVRNMPSFKACSKLIASLSSYQYTRKAWKKDVFDLLLDNNLFQMDHSCLRYWKIIVDHLMTHDNTTFKDLMSRVSMTQSGSLNIFTSREQEYEQRAQLLKRLAFVIFCSETDQYAKYMPDIQEQLTTSLRLNVPGVQTQVFLCFRVLLIRMSSMQVTSLWPIIISEMLQIFLQIEQELSTDTEEFSSHIKLMSALDASWAINSNNGLHALGHPNWLRLQFAAAKLLDLALLLPATYLPQFQMYRWAFVGDNISQVSSSNISESTCFLPHVTRIANLMDQKFTDTQIETLPTKQNELLLTSNTITQLKDLHGFFKTLSLCSNRHRTDCGSSGENVTEDKKLLQLLEKVDKIIEMDFLDKIPR